MASATSSAVVPWRRDSERRRWRAVAVRAVASAFVVVGRRGGRRVAVCARGAGVERGEGVPEGVFGQRFLAVVPPVGATAGVGVAEYRGLVEGGDGEARGAGGVASRAPPPGVLEVGGSVAEFADQHPLVGEAGVQGRVYAVEGEVERVLLGVDGEADVVDV